MFAFFFFFIYIYSFRERWPIVADAHTYTGAQLDAERKLHLHIKALLEVVRVH